MIESRCYQFICIGFSLKIKKIMGISKLIHVFEDLKKKLIKKYITEYSWKGLLKLIVTDVLANSPGSKLCFPLFPLKSLMKYLVFMCPFSDWVSVIFSFVSFYEASQWESVHLSFLLSFHGTWSQIISKEAECCILCVKIPHFVWSPSLF